MLIIKNSGDHISDLLKDYMLWVNKKFISSRGQLEEWARQVLQVHSSQEDDNQKLTKIKLIETQIKAHETLDADSLQKLQTIITFTKRYYLGLIEKGFNFNQSLDTEEKLNASLGAFILENSHDVGLITEAVKLQLIIKSKDRGSEKPQKKLKKFCLQIEDQALQFILNEMKKFYSNTKIFFLHFDLIGRFAKSPEFMSLLQLLQDLNVYFGFYCCPQGFQIVDEKVELDPNKFLGGYTNTLNDLILVPENKKRIYFIAPEKPILIPQHYIADNVESLNQIAVEINKSKTLLNTMDVVMKKLKAKIDENWFFIRNIEQKNGLYLQLAEMRQDFGGFAPITELCDRITKFPQPIFKEMLRSSHTKELGEIYRTQSQSPSS